MIRIFFVTVLAAVFFNSQAQQAPIAIVSSNGTTRLTSTLDSAALLADTDDIIYLPGGTFAGQTVNFTKKVTVIGVGHNPDSTSATGRTFINGNISFYNGAQGSVLDGLYVSGNVYFTASCKIYRTNADVIAGHTDHLMENVIISQSVVRTHLVSGFGQFGFAGSIFNTKVSNCIIGSVPGSNFTAGHNNTIYENCIFLFEGTYAIDGANLSTFRNCTFTGINSWVGESNSFFYNNVFSAAGVPPLTNPSNAINNITGQTAAATFVVAPNSTYSYANDYLINPSSLALTGGTGGTQIGIYGGASPWVKGNIPPNPHIRTKNVDAATGAGGTLRVRFNVSVQ